jgi:hypothetical protein
MCGACLQKSINKAMIMFFKGMVAVAGGDHDNT